MNKTDLFLAQGIVEVYEQTNPDLVAVIKKSIEAGMKPKKVESIVKDSIGMKGLTASAVISMAKYFEHDKIHGVEMKEGDFAIPSKMGVDITKGKEYKILSLDRSFKDGILRFKISDNTGFKITCKQKRCPQINYANWEIKPKSEDKP